MCSIPSALLVIIVFRRGAGVLAYLTLAHQHGLRWRCRQRVTGVGTCLQEQLSPQITGAKRVGDLWKQTGTHLSSERRRIQTRYEWVMYSNDAV